MLSQSRKPICLSLMSFDMPLWSIVETSATLYQKDHDQFHVLLTEPAIQGHAVEPSVPGVSSHWNTPHGSAESNNENASDSNINPPSRLLWLEISPYRVTMTMQGNGQFSYRHFWEQGVYGLNRYWLQGDRMEHTSQMRLRNFTRNLTLTGNGLPEHLRLEYELWSHRVCLGHYVMNLDIQ